MLHQKRRGLKGSYNLLVFLQAALIVSGGSVRLTGSGLGCPTWPECTPGSYTPIPNQAEGQLHAWIEFGNRLLTILLLLIAVIVLIISIRISRQANNKKRIKVLALLQPMGIFGQGILGGITVLTDLHPITVALHYILSIFLISGALSLKYEVLGNIVERPTGVLATLLPIIVWNTLLVLIVGTVVTGSGPHAGDESSPRFDFDPRLISWLHADLVISLIIITSISYLLAKQSNQLNIAKRLLLFLIISLSQALIGYVQYFTGLPIVVVALHLIGSTLVWGVVWSIASMTKVGFKLQGPR